MKLTDLEVKVVRVLSEENGNGYRLQDTDEFFGDYLCLWYFKGIDNKVLRGVLSSLVKKEVIEVDKEVIEDMDTGDFKESTVKMGNKWNEAIESI